MPHPMQLNMQSMIGPSMKRTTRAPQHRFHIRHEPYQIQPFLLAPVLPGETMKSAVFQVRAVSDPVVNPLIGWWLEHYFFYVKHTDLADRDDFKEMFTDPTKDMDALRSTTAVAKMYFGGGGDKGMIDYTTKCLQRVVEEYFRDEGESWNAQAIDGVPLARIAQPSWLDSVIEDADMVVASDVDVDLNADSTITVSEVEKAMMQWQFARMSGLITEAMSYEDFLRSYGIRAPVAEEHKPELIRYTRQWSYPTNTIDPTDGSPSSALSYSVRERLDKARFFREPGFIFGVTVFRPKVYLSGQVGSAAGLMDDVWAWMPALLTGEASHTWKKVEGDTNTTAMRADGPLSGVDDDYWVDVRDLLLYGDQFVNFVLTETDAGLVALPSSTLEKNYVAEAAIDALFVNAASNLMRQDGVASLQIATHQVDTSPTMNS